MHVSIRKIIGLLLLLGTAVSIPPAWPASETGPVDPEAGESGPGVSWIHTVIPATGLLALGAVAWGWKRRARRRPSTTRGMNEMALQSALDSLDAGIFDWDLTHGLLHCSTPIASLLNTETIAVDENLIDLLETRTHPDDRCHIAHSLRHFLDFPGRQELSINFRVFDKDNRIGFRKLKSRLTLDPHDGSRHLCGSISDVTTVHEQNRTIHRHAFHDALTGLPNRKLFARNLQQTLERLDRDGRRVALLLLDINRFRHINDTLGHDAGDRLVRLVSDRLTTLIHTNQLLARLGGDEFALLLPNSSEKHAKSVAARITRSLMQPLRIGDHTLVVEAGIGAALYPDHGESVPELLKHAEVAMYHAKHRCLTFSMYDPNRDPNSLRLLSLENELRNAIHKDGLELHYQPKVKLDDRRIVGAEALLRWQHPTFGDVSPREIVPLAESCGLIRPLTRRVIERALQQAVVWRARGVLVPIAVNISIHDIQDPEFIRFVEGALLRNGLPAGALQIEITESVMMADLDHTIVTIEKLGAMGVEIAIDDFGTGFSSLAYLKRFPVSQLKIDKLFVTDMLDDNNSRSIVRSTIELAHNVGMKAVAEGVEDIDTLRELTAMGCDMAQGFAISRPLPAEAFLAWAANSHWRVRRPERTRQKTPRTRKARDAETG
jgi:diguanylate cyclase (GGDEF)-like protein